MTQVYNRRVNEITSQPMHTYIKIWVGDTLLATDPARPNFMQGFDFTRLEDYGSRVVFTIFDDNWEEIEYAFAMNPDNIKVQYGYANGKLESDVYNMRLLQYSISFAFTGVYLTINAISEGTVSNLETKSITTNTYNPTEAVKIICKEMGWTVLDENFDESEDVDAENPYNMNNDNAVTYIQSVILPDAQSNGENFTFYLDDTTEPPTAHFKKLTYGMLHESELKTYVYQKGYDSVVKDMNFDTKGIFGGTSNFKTATGYVSSVIDPNTKEQKNIRVDTHNTITVTTGKYQMTSPNQSIPVVDSAGYSPQQAHNRLYYRIKNATDEMYQATMTIIGDPTLKILEDIRIINVTDAGYLHHTSGIYKIMGLSDSISGGQLLTSLKLQRTGDIELGLELLNYRELLK